MAQRLRKIGRELLRSFACGFRSIAGLPEEGGLIVRIGPNTVREIEEAMSLSGDPDAETLLRNALNHHLYEIKERVRGNRIYLRIGETDEYRLMVEADEFSDSNQTSLAVTDA